MKIKITNEEDKDKVVEQILSGGDFEMSWKKDGETYSISSFSEGIPSEIQKTMNFDIKANLKQILKYEMTAAEKSRNKRKNDYST